MDHFKQGGNFILNGNICAAIANCGREAYGATSFGVCTGKIPLDDKQVQPLGDNKAENGDRDRSTAQSSGAGKLKDHASRNGRNCHKDIAPMVEYAKSQGLYFGVSIDRLKFFTRNDINLRSYKDGVYHKVLTAVIHASLQSTNKINDLRCSHGRCRCSEGGTD